MCRSIFFFGLVLSLLGCTNLDDKHDFRYEISGAAVKVDNMHVKMGPGVDFNSNGEVDLPVSITHEIYGENLIYFFEVEHTDQNADVNLKVFIDDVLITENNTFVKVDGVPTITIEGVFN